MKTDAELLESMSHIADLAEHEDGCGQCEHQRIMAQVAKELKNATVHEWSAEVEKRWRESKYFKLWDSESKAGRDPNAAFEKLGWEA